MTQFALREVVKNYSYHYMMVIVRRQLEEHMSRFLNTFSAVALTSLISMPCIAQTTATPAAAANASAVNNAIEMTAEEFSQFRTYVNLKDAPKLVNLAEKQKRAQIAKSINITPAQLDAAIAKGEAAGEGLVDRTISAVQAELDKTPVKGRIKEVTVDTSTEQAVMFVKWQAANALDFDKEACHVAAAVKARGHIVSLVVLWAVNNNDATVFSAKVGRQAFTKINPATINSFASTRYIKMFEEVRRGLQQQAPTLPPQTPAAN